MKAETFMPAEAAISLRTCHSLSVIMNVRCFFVVSFMCAHSVVELGNRSRAKCTTIDVFAMFRDPPVLIIQ